jgi:hypothetical protein
VSTHEAIAAVTETLRLYLFQRLGGAACTVKPPDIARDGIGNQLNLFLYQVSRNGAWANMDLPSQTRPGEAGRPPLALDLSYLVTAYGDADSDVNAHLMIGRAMRLLHDHPLLGREEIEQAGRAANLPSGLHQQIERIRLTHEPLSADELSRLWTSFQTGYRISTAYKAAVVLIDSVVPSRMAPPVVSRGENDAGAAVLGDAHAWPALDSVGLAEPARRVVQPSARLGDTLALEGHRLTGGELRFRNQHLAAPIVRQPDAPAGATRLEVTLPNTPGARKAWPPGLWTVAVAVKAAGRDQASNELPFPLAPRLEKVEPQQATPIGGLVTLTVTCSPEVHREQRISLLLGDREVLAQPLATGTASTATLSFRVQDATAGTFLVRLRVDGVDSDPRKPDDPFAFNPKQQVTIS